MDSIADLLVRIKNALNVCKETIDLPHSRTKEAIGKILLAEGYISNCEIMTRANRKYLRIRLKYNSAKKAVITGMKKISTPGRRVYVRARAVPRVRSGFGTAILSTPRGVMTDEAARENKIGGEVLCYVW
jgi:small subunit ribosomal protein S8